MDGLKNVWEKIREFFDKLSHKTKRLIFIVAAGVIIFSVGAALYLNNKPYEVLFTGLNEQESSEIIGKLQESAVDYKFENNGTILVPKEQEQKLKAQLVYEGYPKSGFTYDVFKNNIDMMTTDFEKDNYKLFDLQNRMGATIALFDGVKDAKVTIALGENQKYVLDTTNESQATASVVVIMKNGGAPTQEQVKGIQRLVSKSIPQLSIENVAVLDGNGNDVTVADEGSQSGANKLKLEFEKAIEDSIKGKVLNVLSPIYGAENIRVSVKSTVDVDKKIRELINYSPQEDTGKGVPSSETFDQEMTRGGENAGGVPGAEANADIPQYQRVQPDGTETSLRNQDTIDYLVSQLKEQAQIDAGELKDLSISVAINGNGLGELSKNDLTTLIAKASGIDPAVQADKIAIVSAPFYQQAVPTPPVVDDNNIFGINKWILIGAAAGFALLLLLILILVIRSKSKKKKRMATGAYVNEKVEMEPVKRPVVESNLGADLLNIKNERGMELKNKIRDFSEENPEISAQLLRSWLRGEETDGE